MKMEKWLFMVTIMLLTPITTLADDSKVLSTNGSLFVIGGGTGQEKIFEVTSDGKVLINGKVHDFEPPAIVIETPPITEGSQTIRATFTDNQGLFKFYLATPDNDEKGTLFAGEKFKIVEYTTTPLFAQDTKIEAYAMDFSGNATAVVSTISSDTAITPGTYILDVPLDEEISGDGCTLQNSGTIPLVASKVIVEGRFKAASSRCDWHDENEDPNDAIACISVYVLWDSDNPMGNGHVTSGINSVSVLAFSKDQSSGTGGGGGDESWRTYTYMDVEFFDTTPPTMTADMILRCESSGYGTTEFGPYKLQGTLQQ